MKLHSCLLACALAIPAAAHADTTFSFSGTTFDNGTFSGSIAVNTTSGAITGDQITYKSLLGTYTFSDTTFSNTSQYQGSNGAGAYYAFFTDAAGAEFDLLLGTPSLVNFAGSTICSVSHLCSGNQVGGLISPSNAVDPFASAAFNGSSAVTPEPGSLALVGTGLLGAIGAFRRRSLA